MTQTEITRENLYHVLPKKNTDWVSVGYTWGQQQTHEWQNKLCITLRVYLRDMDKLI